MMESDIPNAVPVRDRPCAWRVLLVALTIAAYGLGVSRHWHVGMDQAFYASIARSIATGQGYTFSGATQWSVPPVTPLYLAAAYRLGQWMRPGASLVDSVVYLNAFMCAAALAGLVAAFFLIREIVTVGAPPELCAERSRLSEERSKHAISLSPTVLVTISSCLLVFSARYYRLSTEQMTDVPYCLVSWAAVLFFLKSWRTSHPPQALSSARFDLAAAAFILAVAPLVRMTAGVLILSIVIYLLLRAAAGRSNRRNTLTNLAALAPAAVTWLAMLAVIWLNRDTGAFNYLSSHRRFRDDLLAWPSNLAETPGRLFGVLFGLGSMTVPGAAVLFIVAAGAVAWWRSGHRFVVSYVALSMILTTALEQPQTRYFVPMLPFIYLFGIEGVLLFAGWIAAGASRVGVSSHAQALVRRLFVAGAIGVLALTLAANLRPIYGAISLNFGGDFYRRYQNGEYYDYFALARDLVSNPPSGAVMAREHRVIFALSGVPVCPDFPMRAAGGPQVSEITQYVLDHSVAAIVIDPRHAESANAFSNYVLSSSLGWRVTGTYGTLTVYSRAR